MDKSSGQADIRQAMNDPDILVLGEPLVEMVRLDGLPDGPATYQSGVGGDVLNVAVAAVRQGARAGLISAVGNDPFGRQIRSFCKSETVDVSDLSEHPVHPTGLCFIDPDPKSRRFSYVRSGSAASHFQARDLPGERIAGAKILHVTAISLAISPEMRAAVHHAARVAREGETLVSFDLNLRLKLWSLDAARQAIEEFLPLADIVLPSDDEALQLMGSSLPEVVLPHYLRHGARMAVLKRGAQGVVLRADGPCVPIPAPKVEAVDSTGAGDSFAGAFLAGLIATNDPVEAARRAVRVAAMTVTGYGATAAIPYRHQV